jgi:hypothetical protein
MTHRNAFVFAPSASTSIDVDAIPPAASRADAKNNTLMGMVDDMRGEMGLSFLHCAEMICGSLIVARRRDTCLDINISG